MATEAVHAEGGCLCGAVRYRATGAQEGAGYCHCQSCRRHTGAPLAAFAVFGAEQVEWVSGERARYESSPGKYRAFCRECGSTLSYEARFKGKDLVELHISSLDDPDAFPPNEHTHYKERISWLHLTDDLRKYPGSMN